MNYEITVWNTFFGLEMERGQLTIELVVIVPVHYIASEQLQKDIKGFQDAFRADYVDTLPQHTESYTTGVYDARMTYRHPDGVKFDVTISFTTHFPHDTDPAEAILNIADRFLGEPARSFNGYWFISTQRRM